MHAENVPEAAEPIKPRGIRQPKPVSPAEAASVRLLAATLHDREIASEMGCTIWRVLHVRKSQGIAAYNMWSDEMLAVIKRRYLDDGEPARAVALDLGLLPASMTRKCRAMGWVQSDEVKRANLRAGALASSRVYSANCATKKRAKPAPKAAHATPAVKAAAPAFVRWPGAQLFVFAAPKLETETLGDRILRELSAKPLSACSLATLLGEKEELVGRQLRVFAFEGVAVGGSIDERGARYQPWSLVSSVAQTAASLRCGPDSLVVAGEAA